MKNTFFLLIFFVSFFNAQNSFKINGHLTGFNEKATVSIVKDNFVIDSCNLINENFILKGNLQNAPSGVYLQVKDGNIIKYSFLFIGNENIKINANINDFPFDVKAIGSKFDSKRYELIQKQKPLQIEREKILEEMFALKDQKKWNDSLQNLFWSNKEPFGKVVKIDKQYEKLESDFIEQNINTYYGLYILNQNKTQIANNKIVEDLKKLKPKFKKSFYVNSINSHLEYPDLKIGEKFYDFDAYNSTNKKIKFSDFASKNKYLLLDFSTFYCGFCIASIPQLEKLKKENSNLEIVTFFVDNDDLGYNKLKNKHSANWNMIWDKKGRLSETYAQYKVYGTPTLFLFNPDGTLLQKFDGFTEDLGEEISKLLIE